MRQKGALMPRSNRYHLGLAALGLTTIAVLLLVLASAIAPEGRSVFSDGIDGLFRGAALAVVGLTFLGVFALWLDRVTSDRGGLLLATGYFLAAALLMAPSVAALLPAVGLVALVPLAVAARRAA
jgi:hypothetical protein